MLECGGRMNEGLFMLRSGKKSDGVFVNGECRSWCGHEGGRNEGSQTWSLFGLRAVSFIYVFS